MNLNLSEIARIGMARRPVFVDAVGIGPPFRMWSADLNALHTMAMMIGVRRDRFQVLPFAHYIVVPSNRDRAIELGAVENKPNEQRHLEGFERQGSPQRWQVA